MAYTPSCMHACVHMALLQALNILLLASMLVLGSAEEAPSGYRIELIHVDAKGGFTREELIRRAVDRTDHRAAMLSAAIDGTNSPASSRTYPLKNSHHEYLMKLEIGTPPKDFWAVADTGSDFVWTKQLDLCDRQTSSTFTRLNCASATVMCGICCDGHCMFCKKFSSGTAIGFVGNETLTLSGKTTAKISDVSFGCAIDHDDKLLPEGADGIVGLNRGPMSLLQQLHVNNFSYCLRNQIEPQLSSQLTLNHSAGGKSSSSLTTKLVQVSIEPPSVLENMYFVELEGISIGNNEAYKSIEKEHFKLKSTNGNGVMFLDTGTPRTILESTVFRILKELLAKELNVDPESKGKKTCFRAAPSEATMVLYFTGGAQMSLPWKNYMDDEEEGLFCLGIRKGKYSALGNFQQQNTWMQYDLDKGELSFEQNVDCSKP